MLVIDTHTHVVSPDFDRYPLSPAGLPGGWYRDAPHSADELSALMDAADVSRAILVQGVGAYSYDNRYAADSALAAPERFWSACCVDPLGADPVGALTHCVRERGMRGARFFALSRTAEPSWLARPVGEPLWRAAREFGIHVIVTLLFHQLEELEGVLARYPDVAVSLDHCGFPPLETAPEQELAPLLALAHHANLHLKVSTHVLDAAASQGEDAQEAVGVLAKHFGAGRLMWGSDFCQTYDRPYAELVALGRQSFAGLSQSEQEQALGATALHLWS